ncbi:hypothetical protein A0H76_3030 [Hepatospora eriocheir]|uniref:Uncharacterized protein n=1 Tax=Hepatospora eriocheir TaxID=1081669 RepID=A0A1X0QI06_9MICR|nr:hypothetical protein A0H76_3030 [Hepatospora eriocheir]
MINKYTWCFTVFVGLTVTKYVPVEIVITEMKENDEMVSVPSKNPVIKINTGVDDFKTV